MRPQTIPLNFLIPPLQITRFQAASEIPARFIERNVSLRGKVHSVTERGLEVEHVPIHLPVLSRLLSKHKGNVGCPLSEIMEACTQMMKNSLYASLHKNNLLGDWKVKMVQSAHWICARNLNPTYCFSCLFLSCYTKNDIVIFLLCNVRLCCIWSSFHEWEWQVSLLAVLSNPGVHRGIKSSSLCFI